MRQHMLSVRQHRTDLCARVIVTEDEQGHVAVAVSAHGGFGKPKLGVREEHGVSHGHGPKEGAHVVREAHDGQLRSMRDGLYGDACRCLSQTGHLSSRMRYTCHGSDR